ncbi:hypothetical protein [Actinokineospora xionganensis]|nr:hypothetical protein [Actinokineospora xionganensis]
MRGYLELAASTTMYGLGIVAQTIAARRAEQRPGSGLGLLARLATDRIYLLGFAGQVGGFALAFLARESLPLYLVQAGSSSAVGLATVFGVLMLRWRVRGIEIAMLLVMAFGLALLAAASTPSVANDIPTGTGLAMLGLPLLAGAVAVHLGLVTTAVPLAIFAGLAFSVVAITSRTIADESLTALVLHPLAWLMLVAALVGQACFAMALQRGSTTSTAASMDGTTVMIASAVGVLALGDQIAPGRSWWVALGLTLVVFGVLVLGAASRSAPAVVTAGARELG